ncbi:hypothetical protein [Spirosoma knui]
MSDKHPPQQLTIIPGGGNKSVDLEADRPGQHHAIRYDRPGVKGREGPV